MNKICNTCPMRSDLSKKIDGNVKKAVKIRLEALLEHELERHKRWKDTPDRLLTPTKRVSVERYHRKRIQALRIVIWMCSSWDERFSDIPNLFNDNKTVIIAMAMAQTLLELVTFMP